MNINQSDTLYFTLPVETDGGVQLFPLSNHKGFDLGHTWMV